MEWIFSLDEIHLVAKQFWNEVEKNNVIAFHGSMGAGKTTFIHALCEAKQVKDIVSSPTFSLINEYEYSCEGTKRALFHMDLYRLKNEEEAVKAGIEDCLYSGNLCLLEWPEKAPGILPPETVHVFIDWVDDKTRQLKIADI